VDRLPKIKNCRIPASIEITFSILDNTPKMLGRRESERIGLGLTIAEQAAREHGGGLNLEESIPGKTVFVLQLPNLVLELPFAEPGSE
jgi:hypothetical protein